MKIDATKVNKGILSGEKEIAVLQFKTFFGWTHTTEITKKTYELIGETMGWKK